jgi:hypothetical protein
MTPARESLQRINAALSLVEQPGLPDSDRVAIMKAVLIAQRAMLLDIASHPDPGEHVGKKPTQAGAPWDEQSRALLRGLWLEGLPLLEIAQRLGRTPDAIAARIARDGLTSDRGEAKSLGKASAEFRRAVAATRTNHFL